MTGRHKGGLFCCPKIVGRLLAEVEHLNKVSRYLAGQMVRPTPNGKKYVGAEDEWGLTREEAVQSWLDEADREVSNAE